MTSPRRRGAVASGGVSVSAPQIFGAVGVFGGRLRAAAWGASSRLSHWQARAIGWLGTAEPVRLGEQRCRGRNCRPAEVGTLLPVAHVICTAPGVWGNPLRATASRGSRRTTARRITRAVARTDLRDCRMDRRHRTGASGTSTAAAERTATPNRITSPPPARASGPAARRNGAPRGRCRPKPGQPAGARAHRRPYPRLPLPPLPVPPQPLPHLVHLLPCQQCG